LIQKLAKIGRFDVAADIIKKYRLPLKKYEDIQLSLIENSARSMPNWEKDKFSWEVLEEVYFAYPSAIAACIKRLSKEKKAWKESINGVFIIILSLHR
jgi:hypothetical protein